jgi:glutamate-ammonia-ligase adenylyltransferase
MSRPQPLPTEIARLPWPLPADPAASQRLTERFIGLGGAEQHFANTPDGAALLAALGGNAPYLADLALLEPATLMATITKSPQASFEAAMDELRRLPLRTSRSMLMRALRQPFQPGRQRAQCCHQFFAARTA